ncbi:hypothetical protein HZU73_00607 [Apis mellifera caucasica]|uniref:Uncharacterized protein LOC100577325 isoform X1 n=1 Tax=Apis mellifera TaxID=7460 RepID=A0A7M7GDK4_APIME|nr:uncharacterized protein LOC100577325 isoform X1 [Apis mellifera]KAG6803893.1 hypothetical protein HZU73_00607 [Apis mellifera caucasica]KAG9437313.1 hypothetical protein HZU67_00322 [Apis mellifera carnica]|eukprot:XP_003249360.1 uncharacterized protein LOC100577325 isoform X1 [Apis mellifera]
MPDSGAVYQPTTVGYTYDSGGDGAGGGGSLRSGFWRIISRHKLSSRKWFEWVLLSIALSFFIAGLTTMLVSFVSDDTSQENKIKVNEHPTTSATSIEEHIEDAAKSSIALSASMILIGLLLGFGWAWLRFFRRGKSPRGGMAGSSGQMLGGLNPSTDLLVGSTSQYGPVLTELPSQLKLKQTNSHDTPAIPLSDQEEETRTLMQDSTIPSVLSTGPNTITNQIPG